MNREILFRGKSIGTGEWLYGYLFNYGLTAPSNVPCISVCVPTSWEEAYSLYAVHPDTIGQYTGLKDKDGNKIFEGDILEYIGKRKDNMNKVYRRKVVFHEGMFALLSKELQAYSALKHHCMEDGRFAWSVIGNIHDNPELMK
ncbi:YopX family protein [Prevotella pallens]|uniref:YopX family protein n=1 Tax=Prevotella pallens TaxID=60133 RepID=UPI0028F064AE|nr:YopX family protein [Prevotella pallens]